MPKVLLYILTAINRPVAIYLYYLIGIYKAIT